MDNKDSSRNRPSSRSPCELLNRVLEAFQGAESPKTNPLRELLFRMVVGDHPILIRAEQAEVSDTRLAEVLRLSPVQLRTLQNHPDGSCHGLGRENVKNFCDYYQISPANIVPLMDNPFLSLPSEITAEILHRLGAIQTLKRKRQRLPVKKDAMRDLKLILCLWMYPVGFRSSKKDLTLQKFLIGLGRTTVGQGILKILRRWGLNSFLRILCMRSAYMTLTKKFHA